MGFDPRAFRRLMKKPSYPHTDCPNFIKYRSLNTYRWYARVVSPILVATGGGPRFTGTTKEVLYGNFDYDSWMVVRYPSHQAMLKMATNPYYLVVCNPIRTRAVADFELAFTEPRDPDSGLRRCPDVLALHVNPENADAFFTAVRELASDAGLRVVYESESRYDFEFLTRPKPWDPKPLTYPVTAAVAGGSEAQLRDFAQSPEVVALLDAQASAAAVLYERMSKLYYLKFGN